MWREHEKSCKCALSRSKSERTQYIEGDIRTTKRGPRLAGAFSTWLAVPGLLLILLATGCMQSSATPATRDATPTTRVTATAPANPTSIVRFTFSGGQSASYTLHTNATASELRHGHREFTIILSEAGVSLFIVFYGYQGPGNYMLSDSINGGDIHIGLEHDTISWDLLMQPAAHCSLNVASDIPTNSPGLDRMQGSFACPLLLSSSPHRPQKPVTVSNGSFDIAIVVAS